MAWTQAARDAAALARKVHASSVVKAGLIIKPHRGGIPLSSVKVVINQKAKGFAALKKQGKTQSAYDKRPDTLYAGSERLPYKPKKK